MLRCSPELALRLGLGSMYLYSGYGLFMNPKGWTWAVPWWFAGVIKTYFSLESYLMLQGVVEFLFAIILLLWFLPKKLVFMVSIISAAELLFILLFAPQFFITFRDLGVLGASVALVLILLKEIKASAPNGTVS